MSAPSTSTGRTDAAPSNVLLLAPTFVDQADAACAGLFGPADDERVRAVVVACRQSPRERLAVLESHGEATVSERAVVDVQMDTRSATPRSDGGPAAPTRIESVADPSDLVDMGATIDGLLADPTSSATRRVLCVHSLTDLIESVDTREVYNFLEVLTRTVDRTDAVAHYHLDPTAHDPETIRTFEELFDESVDVRRG
jgi:hypothetical protein